MPAAAIPIAAGVAGTAAGTAAGGITFGTILGAVLPVVAQLAFSGGGAKAPSSAPPPAPPPAPSVPEVKEPEGTLDSETARLRSIKRRETAQLKGGLLELKADEDKLSKKTLLGE